MNAMNSRRFTAIASRASDLRIAHVMYGGRLLRCGISIQPMSQIGLVSASPVQTAMRNCTRDGGGPFEVGNQVLTSSHRKLLSSKAMVVSVAETSGQ
jgi:hypothetical protein